MTFPHELACTFEQLVDDHLPPINPERTVVYGHSDTDAIHYRFTCGDLEVDACLAANGSGHLRIFDLTGRGLASCYYSTAARPTVRVFPSADLLSADQATVFALAAGFAAAFAASAEQKAAV